MNCLDETYVATAHKYIAATKNISKLDIVDVRNYITHKEDISILDPTSDTVL
jgi:Cu/Ag efflux protein CusF